MAGEVDRAAVDEVGAPSSRSLPSGARGSRCGRACEAEVAELELAPDAIGLHAASKTGAVRGLRIRPMLSSSFITAL
ncbi:MAG TPA: hypothetical protein VEU32_20280 [Burkholderiales bacterium]|nr:hypothetical protein [Burkholderiales bacterium]